MAKQSRGRTHPYKADDGKTLLFEHKKSAQGNWWYRHPLDSPVCYEHGADKVKKYGDQYWCNRKPAIADTRLHLHRSTVKAAENGDPIAICAGEKDSTALAKARRAAGLPYATTSIHQGETKDFSPKQLKVFEGTTSPIEIFMDWDVHDNKKKEQFTGQKAALRWLKQLSAVVDDPSQISLWRPAEGYNDVADHLADGKGLDEFTPLTAEELREWLKEGEQPDAPPPSPQAVSEHLRAFEEALADAGCERGSGEDWTCPHPDHDDTNPSFGVTVGKNGGLVIFCQVCTPNDEKEHKKWISQVLKALELPRSALRPPRPREVDSWEPIDLATAMTTGRGDDKPATGLPASGQGLFYPGKTHTVSGEPESMKTWLLLASAAHEMNLGNNIVYIDFEDDAHSVGERLLALGVAIEDLHRCKYIRPEDGIGDEQSAVLVALIEEHRPTLAVIDGVTEGMTLHGWDPDNNKEAAEWMKALPRKIASVRAEGYTGPALVQIDHVVKNKENRGRGSIGAQHKLASLSGAHYSLEVKAPLAPGATGIATLRVTKDRPGRIRERATGKRRDLVGELVIASASDGALMAEIIDPPEHDEATGYDVTDNRPEELMQRVSEYVQKNPGLSKNAIKAGVSGGRGPTKDLAIELLVNEGYIAVTRGPRNSHLHTFEKPYTAYSFTLKKESESTGFPPGSD